MHPFNKMNQWVGSPVDYRTGDRAKQALSEINDNHYWDDETGSILVDKERWLQAQNYEKDTWMKHGLGSADDRDAQHTANFDDYKALPLNLGRLVEFGCGPFTQTYNVCKGRRAESIDLIDPLLNEYRQHPHCRYDKLVVPKSIDNDERVEEYAQITYHPIPAEDFVPVKCDGESKRLPSYDTAIMINVLEHVCDATKVMKNLIGCIKSGGLLIFHDRVYDGLDITKIYDIGHPIRITSTFLKPFLDQLEPLYNNKDYYIGRKK